MTAYSGKCPAKCGSLTLTDFQPVADCPGTMSEMRSTYRNGARCGNSRLICSISSTGWAEDSIMIVLYRDVRLAKDMLFAGANRGLDAPGCRHNRGRLPGH